jgi:hypothetical protein
LGLKRLLFGSGIGFEQGIYGENTSVYDLEMYIFEMVRKHIRNSGLGRV